MQNLFIFLKDMHMFFSHTNDFLQLFNEHSFCCDNTGTYKFLVTVSVKYKRLKG